MTPVRPSSEHEHYREKCAWCGRFINASDPAFAISIQLLPEAWREVEGGSIELLLLPRAERRVPMILTKVDSPARREGKDGVFQLCSEGCAKALRTALQVEMAPEAPESTV